MPSRLICGLPDKRYLSWLVEQLQCWEGCHVWFPRTEGKTHNSNTTRRHVQLCQMNSSPFCLLLNIALARRTVRTATFCSHLDIEFMYYRPVLAGVTQNPPFELQN
jgi:hypothetical protein